MKSPNVFHSIWRARRRTIYFLLSSYAAAAQWTMDLKRLVEDLRATFRRHPIPHRRQPLRRCDGEGEGNSKPPLVIGEESLCRTRPYYFRRCKRVSPTNIESLPSELLSNILVRLPADYLYDRARLVCRRWYHIIRSDAFVNKQIQHSTRGLLLSCTDGGHPIFMTATQGRVEISELSYESKTLLSNGCNGLALEIASHKVCNHPLIHRSILLIRNPATKQSLIPPPPQPDTHQEHCCIAFAASSMKYKLVAPYLTSDWKRLLFILTFGVDNSWRNVEIDHVPQSAWWVLREPAVITEGFMHWASPTGGPMLTMDVETEIVSLRRTPGRIGFLGKYHLSTGRFLSTLVGYRDFLWEIWEMNSETGEWRRVLPDIKLGGLLHEFAATGENEAVGALLHEYASKGKDEVLVPLGWIKYPEVLVFRFYFGTETCFLYNRETHEINSIELPYPSECYSTFAHKNSLIRLP